MDNSNSTMAKQVALAAIAFEEQRTGRMPKSVTAVMSDHTLVITLHAALTPAEKALAKSPGGAAQVQEFHQQLFNNSGDSLRQEIKRITGVEVREAAVQVDPATGTVLKAFTSGTVVQVFLLADSVVPGAWSGNGRDGQDRIPLVAGVGESKDKVNDKDKPELVEVVLESKRTGGGSGAAVDAPAP